MPSWIEDILIFWIKVLECRYDSDCTNPDYGICDYGNTNKCRGNKRIISSDSWN